ncbi:hypothetical cyanophage protein [Synechococcus phage S-CRM01]|uniref:DNA binding protein n=1 Tax=Synechococcus phage S-CRM01 TaxID=1026955 RepID=UPI000209E43B|nr:DNA binding protein [Synechococcus phage S-CRM01]AEC53180.1 hypothetical cyanophage protein [Synechococcus phage S-CRM01]
MNIFVVDKDPIIAAQLLPDKHVVKMPLETCQMVSVVYSHWYWNIGEIYKKDGNPYSTKTGAFRNHPCTVWAAKSKENMAWLLGHGLSLCHEYIWRYEKIHACHDTLRDAFKLFKEYTGRNPYELWAEAENTSSYKFVRAMPEDIKHNKNIDDVTAYRIYVASKPWVKDNYLRRPERKPNWVPQ